MARSKNRAGDAATSVGAGVVPWLFAIGVVERNGEIVLLGGSRIVGGNVDELRHAGQRSSLVPRCLAELKTTHVGASWRDGGVVAARLDLQDAPEEGGQRRVAARRRARRGTRRCTG